MICRELGSTRVGICDWLRLRCGLAVAMVTMAVAVVATFDSGHFAMTVAVPVVVQYAGHHASERVAHQQQTGPSTSETQHRRVTTLYMQQICKLQNRQCSVKETTGLQFARPLESGLPASGRGISATASTLRYNDCNLRFRTALPDRALRRRMHRN